MEKAIETLATAKAIKAATEKLARGEVKAGQHRVDFMVHVSGLVKVGDDYSAHVVEKAEPWKILAVALSKLNGVTLDALVREAAEKDLDTDNVKAAADAAIEKIKASTVTTCKGKVTTELSVVIVTTDELAKAA